MERSRTRTLLGLAMEERRIVERIIANAIEVDEQTQDRSKAEIQELRELRCQAI